MITLTMDNGSCNDFKKISINFEHVETIEELAKVILIGERQQKIQVNL